MTDQYHAGQVVVSVKLDATELKGQLANIERHIASSGQKASKSFMAAATDGFNSGFEKQFKSSVFKALDGSKEAGKAGEFVVAGFSRSLEIHASGLKGKMKAKFAGVGKIIGGAFKGGLIGIGFEVLSAGAGLLFNKLTEGARKAKEEQEAYNRKLELFNDLITENQQFLYQYKALRNDDIDLLGVASGKVSTLTGKYVTLFDTLNAVHKNTFSLKLEGLEEAKSDAEAVILAQKEVIRTNQAIIDAPSSPYSRTGTDYAKTRARKEISSADAKRQVEQENVDVAKSEIEQLEADQKKLVRGNKLLVAEELKKYFTQQSINVLRANGDEAEAKSLEDQLATEKEIHKLRRLGVPKLLAKILAPGVIKTRRNANEHNLNASEKENEVDPETTERLNSALQFLGSEDRAKFEKAINEARNKQEFVREILAQSQQLREEAQTPLDDYNTRLDQLVKVADDEIMGSLAGGFDTFSTLQIKALEGLVSQTGDYEDGLKKLSGLLKNGQITSEQYGQALSKMIAPIENVSGAIEILQALSTNGLMDQESIAATNEALSELGSKALTDLLSGTLEVDASLNKLLDLQSKGLVTVGQFGQAFQDLTDPVEGAATALERLSELLSKGLIDNTFFDAAKAAIETLKDFEATLKNLELPKIRTESKFSRKKPRTLRERSS